MLTRKQHELLTFIRDRVASDGIPPSFDEMKDALNLKSKSGVHRLVSALEERGFLRRMHHRARAMEVLRTPEDIKAGRAGRVQPPAEPTRMIAEGPVSQLPLRGKIAAGTPIEAISDNDTMIDVPTTLLDSQGEHFALEVAGDSMHDAGIHDGDTVIIRQCDTADSGAIVVALVDEEEATLKTIRRRGTEIALEPANPAYQVQKYRPERVRVQGRLVGLIRRY